MKRKNDDLFGEPSRKNPRIENDTLQLPPGVELSSDELVILGVEANEQALVEMEIDQQIGEFAENTFNEAPTFQSYLFTLDGLDTNEYITMTQICVDTAARLNKNVKNFTDSAKGSGGANLSKIISDFECGKLDGEQAELAIELNEQTLNEAKQMIEEAKRSPRSSVQKSYIQSLSSITLQKCGRTLGRYLMFLNYRQSIGKSNCYELAELKKLGGTELIECLKNLFGQFIEYLCNHHTAQGGTAASKLSKKLEPSTIMSYGYSLIIALKVLGILSPTVGRSKLLGSTAIIQMRKTFKTIKTNSPIFKEAFTPTDAVELIRNCEIASIVDLQNAAMLLLACETGIRIGTLIACNAKTNNELGLKLSMLTFEFINKDRFIVKINIPHQKQDKAKTNDNSYTLDSSAHYCGINAANVLLLFISTVGYTQNGLIESLQSEHVEIKAEFMDFPIFAKVEDAEIKPGEFMGDDRLFRTWISSKSGVPYSLISNRSLRRGNATAIKNSVIAKDSTATDADVQAILIGSGGWANKRNAQLYLDEPHGPLLSNFNIYNLPVEDESRQILVRSNLSSYFLSTKFLEMKLSEKELGIIEKQREKQFNIGIEKAKESAEYETCERIKRENKHLLTKNGQFSKLSALSEPVRTEYVAAKKIRDNAIKNVYSKVNGKFTRIIDAIARRRWMKAKLSLKDEELHEPTIQSNIKLDFCSLADQLKNVGVLSSLDGLCGLNFISEIPAEGMKCPLCEDFVKTFSEFKKHAQDEHDAKTSLKDTKELKYSCKVTGCTRAKNCQYNFFCTHNRKEHGWEYYCQTCKSSVSQANSKNHPSRHILLKPWQFNPLKLDVVSTKCCCFNQVGKKDFGDDLICITEDAEVRSKCVNGPSLEAIYKLYKLKYPNSSMRDCSKAFMAAFLKIEDDQLPECVTKLIANLPI